MKTSEAGLNLIKKHEGLRLEAYKCPSGVWTIGYGHTLGVRPWSVVTKAQAEEKLREDVQVAERTVDQLRYLQSKLEQCQYDALVCFVFNVGVNAFIQSTLRKKVIGNPTDPLIRLEFERWVYAEGKKLPGLIIRRNDEARLYFSAL